MSYTKSDWRDGILYLIFVLLVIVVFELGFIGYQLKQLLHK